MPSSTVTTPAGSATKRSAAQQRALMLFVVLSRAFNSVTERVMEEHGNHDLTPTEFGILEALYHKGPMVLGEVQKKILLSSGGVTYTVDRLVERGLVERRECPTDRRARFAALTPKGEELIARIFPRYARVIEDMMTELSAGEQEQLTTLLRRLGLSVAS